MQQSTPPIRAAISLPSLQYRIAPIDARAITAVEVTDDGQAFTFGESPSSLRCSAPASSAGSVVLDRDYEKFDRCSKATPANDDLSIIQVSGAPAPPFEGVLEWRRQ